MSENIPEELITIATTAAEKWGTASRNACSAAEQHGARIAEHLQTIYGALGAILGEVHAFAAEAEGHNKIGAMAIDLARMQLETKLKGTTNQQAIDGITGLREAYAKIYQVTDDIRATDRIVSEQIEQASPPLLTLLEQIAKERLLYPFMSQQDLETVASLPPGGEIGFEPFKDINETLEQAFTDITGV